MEKRPARPRPKEPERGLFDAPVTERTAEERIAVPELEAVSPPALEPAPAPTRAPAPTPSAPPRASEPPAPPPLYTVQQLTGAIQGQLSELGRVRVEGEVAQKKRTSAGHVYFDLKDAGAKLACKVWQSQVGRVLKLGLVDGSQVVAWGKLDVYAPQGGYSLIVDRLEAVGLGALLAQLEQRKAELAARGWFDRKRPLPRFPRTIGLVTSRDGAALRDFLRTRSLRWPGYPVRLVHTAVQGPGAAESIADALRCLDATGVDVIVLVRGGGSLEDLWAFNELAVAEAIFHSRAPVVTGVGHQSDTTLADLVADHRAHTPTDAAQTVIPERKELCARIARLGNYLSDALERQWSERLQRLATIGSRPVLRDAGWILDERSRALAALHKHLDGALRNQLTRRATLVSRAHARLGRRTPEGELARRAQRLATAGLKLRSGAERRLERADGATRLAARALEGVSPLAVLARGYAIVRRAGGGAATDARDLVPGETIEARLARGSLRARVETVQPPEDGA